MYGTLLPLENKPTIYGENYYTRKGGYAINLLVVCDHEALVTYFIVGWPGSVHDNRVWRTCGLKQNPHNYFEGNEYLLADSAFTAGPHVVPAYKCSPGNRLGINESKFNELLAKTRVKLEHCIGY